MYKNNLIQIVFILFKKNDKNLKQNIYFKKQQKK